MVRLRNRHVAGRQDALCKRRPIRKGQRTLLLQAQGTHPHRRPGSLGRFPLLPKGVQQRGDARKRRAHGHHPQRFRPCRTVRIHGFPEPDCDDQGSCDNVRHGRKGRQGLPVRGCRYPPLPGNPPVRHPRRDGKVIGAEAQRPLRRPRVRIPQKGRRGRS